MKMNKPVMALAIAVCALVLGAPLAHADRDLGGVDVMRWCRAAAGGNAKYVTSPSVNQRDPYSWRCNMSGSPSWGVDMNGACGLQQGNGAYSRPLDAHNAYSWHCFKP
jgi:hypothetical protein